MRRGIGYFLMVAPYRACIRIRSCASHHRTDTKRVVYRKKQSVGRARRIGNEAGENLAREFRSPEKNGIPARRIAGLGGHAPVAWRGTFPVVRRRRGTAGFLQDDAGCIQQSMLARPGQQAGVKPIEVVVP